MLCQLALYGFLCMDLRIFTRITMTSFSNLMTVLFHVLAGVGFGMLTGWDYRGIMFLLVMLFDGIMLVSFESLPFRLRKGGQLTAAALFTLTLVFVNLGLVPNLNLTLLVFTLALEDVEPIPYTWLSLFTESMVGVLVLQLNIFYNFVWKFRNRPRTLPSAVVCLEGVDDPEAGPIETFALFEMYKG
jgi:hypothetical protein